MKEQRVMEINEKKLKGILKEQRLEYQKYAEKQTEDYKRYLGVLREDFDSKVSLLVGQYNSIMETLGSHTKQLDSHTEILNSHTEMIGSMKVDIEIMKVDVSFIKNGLKSKVDVEEFMSLERRVAILEAKRMVVK